MPALPMALPMTFELCAYGVLTGAVYPLLNRLLERKRFPAMLCSLMAAMLLGRMIGGAAKALLLAGGAISGAPLTFEAFIASYFADTAVGAVIHLILVPAVVAALEKARLSPIARTLAG